MMKQLVALDYCRRCGVCCRFQEEDSVWAPKKIRLLPYKDYYVCPHLLIKEGLCRIYERRPFDCQLYPFLLTFHKESPYLAVDKNCPFVKESFSQPFFKEYTLYLKRLLENKEFFKKNLFFIQSYPQEEIIFIFPLKVSLGSFRNLDIKDRAVFERYLGLRPHSLSSYSFVNIYLWHKHFNFSWIVFKDSLCLFAQDELGCFLYLPPLGKRVDKEILDEVFKVMDERNLNLGFSHIENVEAQDLNHYKSEDFSVKEKFPEYLYLREELISLKGDRFKSKRAAYNYFFKNYHFKYTELEESMIEECKFLLRQWADERRQKYAWALYQSLLEDNVYMQMFALNNLFLLGLKARVVKIKERIKAYILGFDLNKDTFCVLSEVADLKIKGITEFIFREFLGELPHLYINTMDDSGFDNLRRSKLSYRPYKLIKAFTVKRRLK